MDTSPAVVEEVPIVFENNKIQLAAPRPAWIEFVLHFFCFGLYTNIWLVNKMREFKRVNNERYTPWLWFFVPFFSIANLIALPKFIRSLNKLEDEAQLDRWNGWKGCWVFGVFVLSVLINIANQHEIKDWMLIILLLAWASLFCAAGNRVNKAKLNIERFEFKPNRFVFSVVEIVLLFIGVPLMLMVIYLSLSTEIFISGKKYKADEIFLSEKDGYTFKILGDGWRQVSAGTHSTDDSSAEFSGPLQDMYLIVFTPTRGSSISSLTYNRLIKYDASYNCQHKHEFNKKGTGVITRITCTSTYVGDPAVDVSTFIETDKGIVEMYGHLSSSKKTFKEYQFKFQKMVEGFEPI